MFEKKICCNLSLECEVKVSFSLWRGGVKDGQAWMLVEGRLEQGSGREMVKALIFSPHMCVFGMQPELLKGLSLHI